VVSKVIKLSFPAILKFLIFASGKSNIIDAIAFALCVPFAPAKHVHTRELVYRANQQNAAA